MSMSLMHFCAEPFTRSEGLKLKRGFVSFVNMNQSIKAWQPHLLNFSMFEDLDSRMGN